MPLALAVIPARLSGDLVEAVAAARAVHGPATRHRASQSCPRGRAKLRAWCASSVGDLGRGARSRAGAAAGRVRQRVSAGAGPAVEPDLARARGDACGRWAIAGCRRSRRAATRWPHPASCSATRMSTRSHGGEGALSSARTRRPPGWLPISRCAARCASTRPSLPACLRIISTSTMRPGGSSKTSLPGPARTRRSTGFPRRRLWGPFNQGQTLVDGSRCRRRDFVRGLTATSGRSA